MYWFIGAVVPATVDQVRAPAALLALPQVRPSSHLPAGTGSPYSS